MATFKVGQRVRRVAGHPGAVYQAVAPGAEGVITGYGELLVPDGQLYEVRWDNGRDWNAIHGSITPITDPDAEKFIESLKKLAREPRQHSDVSTPYVEAE